MLSSGVRPVTFSTAADIISLNAPALVIRQDGTKVFRVNENGIAEVIPVKTGMANNTYIEIKNGINIGDRIVIRGNERLRPGHRVVIEPGK